MARSPPGEWCQLYEIGDAQVGVYIPSALATLPVPLKPPGDAHAGAVRLWSSTETGLSTIDFSAMTTPYRRAREKMRIRRGPRLMDRDGSSGAHRIALRNVLECASVTSSNSNQALSGPHKTLRYVGIDRQPPIHETAASSKSWAIKAQCISTPYRV